MSGQYARAAQADDASTVRLLLDWKANATHAGSFVAKQKGFYEDEGLSVTIDSGTGGLSTAKQIGLQKYTFGLTSAAAVLQTRAKDLDIRSYTAAQQGPNSAVYTTAGAFGETLSRPEQLPGKTIAVPAAASNLAVLKAILKQRGILDMVNFLNVGWGQLTPSVLSGDADAALGAFPDGIALERKGYNSSMLWLMDYVPTVGRLIAAHPTVPANNPETLRAFLRATAKGWAWASNQPEAAMDLLIDARSQLQTTRELGILKIKYTVQKLILTETVRKHGWGHQPATAWQTGAEILRNAEIIPTALDVKNAWTNEYLDTDAPYIGNYAKHVSLDYDVV
jgi:NitT/TauT family transport system substrate-binding protein